MAVDLSHLSNPKAPAVELYRLNDANPESLIEAIFWLTNELSRIQSMGVSIDEIVGELATAIESIGEEEHECDCPPGPSGSDGEDGEDGRGIHTYSQTSEPRDAQAGDVWFVMG